MPYQLTHYVAGSAGPWQIEAITPVVGQALPDAERLAVIEAPTAELPADSSWALRGTASNIRYATRAEINVLTALQEGLGRPHCTRAALIPIRKADSWWALAQDERRALLAEQSRHIGIGEEYLPAVARRLHHSRDLGEPFDFLTWFEYAPEDGARFEDLVARLRETPEWTHVDREVDVRLSRVGQG